MKRQPAATFHKLEDPSTRRQVKTIRRVLKKLRLESRERFDAKAETRFIEILQEGPSPLASVHLVHGPGMLSIYGVFGVKPDGKKQGELLRFTAIFNGANRSGSLQVGEDGAAIYRAAVNYGRVKDLQDGYVAGLVGELLDKVDLIDLPLILVAKGKTARAAVEETWVSAGALPIR